MTDSSDVTNAKVEAKVAKARVKALRPWYKKKRFWLLGVVVILIIFSVTSKKDSTPSGGVGSLSSNSKNAPVDDISIDSCSLDSFGFAKAELTITNHSSKRSNYLVDLSFIDGNGVKVGDGTAVSSNVDPGQVAKEEAGGTITGSPATVTCKVSSVDRFVSE